MKRQDFIDLSYVEETLWWFRGMREVSAKMLDPYLAKMEQPKIADIGCGTGINLKWLERYTSKDRIFGLDFDRDALRFCKEFAPRRLLQGSAVCPPFPDNSFDVITSFDVLVQVSQEEAREALHEAYRILKPKGLLFVRVAAYQWMRSGHDQALGSQHRYSLSRLKNDLQDCGFVIERSTYANMFLFPIAVIGRLLMKPLGLAHNGSDVKALPSELLNKFFTKIMALEALTLSSKDYYLPFGLSAIAVARKS